ncbi:MAG: nucleotide exchange factor GrpE [Frankiales bacterium]|nr:nucleotide exchange factor GrpE [Frankiales bacterium]
MSDGYSDEPIVRDKRRVDPDTGEIRTPVYDEAQAGAPPESVDAPGDAHDFARTSGEPRADELEQQLAERTADLQRLKAEYDNWRRRIERDKQKTADTALAAVLSNLLPVLDDIGRAREHGELEGGFKSVAEALEAVTVKLGLTPYGEAGDPFDPQVHEALTHAYGDNVTEPTAAQIYQPGYRLGDLVLRPARVGVVEPDSLVEPTDATTDGPADDGAAET